MTSDPSTNLYVRSRRLSKDYEMLTENSEGIVYLRSISMLFSSTLFLLLNFQMRSREESNFIIMRYVAY